MNVLILWTFQSTYLESIINRLIEADNQVTVVYCENLSSYPKLLDERNLENRFFLDDREIPIEIVARNWDVIFVAGWHKKQFRKFLRQRSDIPRVMYTDTQDENSLKFLILGKIFRLLRRIYYDAAYVPGNRQVKFARRLGFSVENSSMGGISYDDSTFFRSLSASKVRNGPFVYVGRISSEKNIQNLCFAYALYREASSEPRDLLLIGPIENYDLLHEQPGIKYEGFQSKNEIALRLNSCRAFLFPSIREPFGVALLEAGACGAPLLTSANVGASDHLVNADNGFIVDSNNPHEICARLLEFDEWDEVALQRASDASSAASLYFSPENWVARFEKLCKKANKRKSGKVRDPKSVHFYLAVIPKYRSKALELLESQLQKPLTLSASAASSDSLVHTDDSNPNIGILGILNFRNKFFLQTGKWCKSIMSDCLVLDLNPRSLTAWFFLILRFPFYKKRTLVWGHLNSRFQSGILNRRLRIFMRYLADGAILYTYSDFIKAKKELPKESIFIAPNAIYSRDSIERSNTEKRNTIIYSGRLVREKKVDLLLSAFKESGLKNRGITLCIIGDGPEMSSLKKLASELDLDNSINFVGESFDYLKLKESYSRAIVSVSPGYVGLSLTQSAGFGVPMILAEQDNHSPEIELVERGNHYFFNSDDFLSLSQIMQLAVKLADNSEFENSCERMVEYVRKNYSAEQMAEGLHAAIFNLSQKLGVEGFPFEN